MYICRFLTIRFPLNLAPKCRKWHFRDSRFQHFQGGHGPGHPQKSRAFGPRFSRLRRSESSYKNPQILPCYACERFVIKLAGETVYDKSGESCMSVSKDLPRTKTDRLQAVEYGIANENLCILICKGDSGANSGNNQNVSDGLMFSIHGTKQKI